MILKVAKIEEKEVIQNMARFYIYEFSKFMPDIYKMASDGLFYDEDYSKFWDDDDKIPYIINSNSELAGFALIKFTHNQFELDQFFILYKFQGSGLAEKAACKIFNNHSSNWIVRSYKNNPKSEGFWSKLINNYTQGKFTMKLQQQKDSHNVYTFSSDKKNT